MNLREIADNLGLEENECRELMELFIETSSADLDFLSAAIAEKDGAQAARAAHSLKGAAINLGLDELFETARIVEEKARTNQIKATAEAAEELKRRFTGLVEALAPVLQKRL
jgi:HPt (histidine-containing phosphotransfer) domain-containing protein